VWKKELTTAENPEEKMEELQNKYRDKFANPYVAAERGYIDDVIHPHETRDRLISGLELLATKVSSMPKKKHGNIPL
jgi:propionyl-CoA carboxylase beta chain